MSRDFLSIATGQSMLTPELAEDLSREAACAGESVETMVARKGLLSSVQMDIIQTLRRPNEIVPGYELLDVIGQGGMGVVYRAWQRTLDRVVAIKTILVSEMGDRQMAARFEREARAVARLQHPNIINAIDFGEHDGRLFFVMELVEGHDLESFIEQQQQRGLGSSVTEMLAWGLARQAASGLAHAAEQGIVHRDIKPANVLLVQPPAGFPLPPGLPLVKIADFGLAFLANTEADAKTRLTAANMTVGTPHYIAPEQLSGLPVDLRADIYALGATLFHLLAGRPPYSGLTLPQLLTQKLIADAPRLKEVRPDISDATNSLVAAMMTRQPEQRIASYTQLLSRVDELLNMLNSATLAELPAYTPTMILAVPTDLPELAVQTERQLAVSETMKESVSRTLAESLPATNPLVATAERRWSRRQAIAGGIGATVLAGIGWGMQKWLSSGRSSVPIKPRLVPSGWSDHLFDGQSLKSWQTRSGQWLKAQDDEGAGVLAGTNGVMGCSLVRGDLKPRRALEHFSLSLVVRLHQARAVELHFGILRTAGGDGIRLAIRLERDRAAAPLERDKAWIVRCSSDRGEHQPITTPVALAAAAEVDNPFDQPRELRVVRDATHWFASVDNQTLGAIPLSGQPELPEFRLLAELGPLWASDVDVEELREPPT